MKLENRDLEYATDVRKARRKTGIKTQEFFTPVNLVKRMCDKISIEYWCDITKTFLEPSFGNGNFLIEIYIRKLAYCSNEEDVYKVLSSVYGIELMEDNVKECKERVLSLFFEYAKIHNMNLDNKKVINILNNNLICSDILKWDLKEWKPIIIS